MKQRCCILGKRSSHFGLVDVDFLDTPFCHLQMTRYRRIRWTLWDFGRYATPTPLMSFFFSLQLATVFLGIWRQFQLRWLELFLWIFVFGIVFFNCLGIPTFFPLKKKNRWYTQNRRKFELEHPKDVVNLGPEGRLIRSTELAKGLLRFGGLYCFLEVNFSPLGVSLNGGKTPNF